MSTIYRKTEQGHNEIATRAMKLVPRLRQALILVDGKRDDDALCKFIPAPGQEVLLALLEQGYIEAIAVSAAPRAAAETVAAPAPAPAVVLTPLEQRQRAVRWIGQRMGPHGDSISMRLEKAKTPDDIAKALSLAGGVVRHQVGAGAAVEFEQYVGLPPGG